MNKLLKSKNNQMSEAFITTLFLTLSGGLQDAYTYMGRGKVFANAQTGNIVLMASNFSEGQYLHALRYLAPLIAFGLGVYMTAYIKQHYPHRPHFHWRQLVVMIEIIILFIVGFLSHHYDTLANILVSFVCAMQVQSFRKVDGNPYASTMCIGNLRSAVDHLYAYNHLHNKKSLHKSLEYFGVIFIFGIGAALGNYLTDLLDIHAIWISCLLLFISLIIMFIKEEEILD